MSVRDLRISFPPSPGDDKDDILSGSTVMVDTIKLTGERNDGDGWQSFSATVSIDYQELAEYFARGGRKVLAHKVITVDSRIFNPQEVQID